MFAINFRDLFLSLIAVITINVCGFALTYGELSSQVGYVAAFLLVNQQRGQQYYHERTCRFSSLQKTTFNDKEEQYKLLIKNAVAIDNNLSLLLPNKGNTAKEKQPYGSYMESTWSNRLGTVLTPVSIPGVYTGDRPFYWNGIDVGGRMTVIQLTEKSNDDEPSLWIHSPIELDDGTRKALEKLGKVKYIVSPNYEHLKYASQWHKEYPDAYMFGCPGLPSRLPEIRWEGEIPYGYNSRTGDTVKDCNNPNCWDYKALTPLHLDMEINPFNGKPFFNEVIFYHRPSKSLLTTDVFWNYPKDGELNSHLPTSSYNLLAPPVQSIPRGSRLWKWGMDHIYLPFYKKFMINDRKYYDAVVNTLLNEWEIETLIPCHGDIIRGKETVRSVLEKHFS